MMNFLLKIALNNKRRSINDRRAEGEEQPDRTY